MGKIVTFYSYKGGTGRSMAVANVAWALATNGHRVLVIDWDLEAPGLHRYFRAFLSDKELIDPESKGLIEFVRNYAMLAATPPVEGERSAKWYEPHAQIWKWAIPLRWPRGKILNFGIRGEIQFVPAGRQGSDYAERINTFDWYSLYQAHGGDRFFESVREQAKREFDYVLVDSRTGVSDTSGICTIQMPDILLVCYTYNLQSIIGASDIAQRVLKKRPEIAVFPVAMRVEFTETDSLIPMRKLARERFSDLITASDREQYFDQAEVPYYPKYSFFERLAAFEEFPNAKGSINSEIRHLGYLITGTTILQTPIEEDQRRNVVQDFEPGPSKVILDVSRPEMQLATQKDWSVYLNRSVIAIGLTILLVFTGVGAWRLWQGSYAVKLQQAYNQNNPPALRISDIRDLARSGRRNFDGLKFSGATLSGMSLEGASFRFAKVDSAALTGSSLSHTDFSGADLSHADLRNATLVSSLLRNTNLSGATLDNADLRGADLTGTGVSADQLINARMDSHTILPKELTTDAGALAVLGANEWANDYPEARSFLDAAMKLDRLRAVETLDKMIPSTYIVEDPRGIALLSARTYLLKNADKTIQSNPEFKKYVCVHDYYVIAASIKTGDTLDFDNWKKEYPRAELGPPTAQNRYMPVIVDFFLTCQEAQAMASLIRSKHGSQFGAVPPLGWYPICSACSGGSNQSVMK